MKVMILPRLLVVAILSGVLTQGIAAAPPTDCTLKPTEGRKQAKLSGKVMGKLTWSACNSMVQDFVFEWPRKYGVPSTSSAALKKAASLVREWRKVTQTGFSPFSDFSEALEKRANQQEPYMLGENIPVTDAPGWDGVSINLSSTTRTIQLTVHYWANP